MNQTYNITSKGQVTLPKALRDRVGLKPGTAAKFILVDEYTIGIRVPMPVSELRKRVGPPHGDQPLTDSERGNLEARGYGA